jgi:uncharacterized protein with von Willebrand factor type A (vWA) domain
LARPRRSTHRPASRSTRRAAEPRSKPPDLRRGLDSCARRTFEEQPLPTVRLRWPR